MNHVFIDHQGLHKLCQDLMELVLKMWLLLVQVFDQLMSILVIRQHCQQLLKGTITNLKLMREGKVRTLVGTTKC